MEETLRLEKTNLALINLEKLKTVFNEFGIKTQKIENSNDERIFLTEEDFREGITAVCQGCGKEVTLNSFGHLVHGSKAIYCKKPLCFNHFLVTNKIKK